MNNYEITATNRVLIQSIIKENPKYKGHEDLMDAFVDAIYRKSYLLLDTIKDMDRLNRHLNAICNSCMEMVIKEQMRKGTEILQPKKPNLLEETPQRDVREEIQEALVDDYEFSLQETIWGQDSMQSLFDPIDVCTKEKTSEDTIDKLVKIIRVLDAQYPQKQFYTMFCLRYIQKNNQLEIAHKLRLSQKDLSKRFVELIKLTKNYA